MTIDLHDLTLPTLPVWGPDVPGAPVEVIYTDGTVGLRYAWRDGRAATASPARKCQWSPTPWHGVRITAVLADDPARWPEVSAKECRQLGDHLAGARVCCERGGATVVGPVAEVDEDGWLWAKKGEEAYLLAAPYHSLRVHPADLAAAREAATPRPPTCWDEWKPGDVWAWHGRVYRMDDDRALRRATHGGGWVPAAFQPDGAWMAFTLTAPTEEHMALVAAADEAARLPEEPPVGSVVLDRDGEAWQRHEDGGWVGARTINCLTWAELNERHGPLTVIHRAEP